MLKKYVLIPMLLFVFLNSEASTQESYTLSLVQDVIQKAQKLKNNIEILSFSGRSKFYDYMGSSILDLNTVRDFEEFYFDGYCTDPDSVRIFVNAFRRMDPDDKGRQYIWSDFPLPNPLNTSFYKSINGLDITVNKRYKINDENHSETAAGDWPLFPFAPGADSLYNYEILSEISMDYRTVIEILVNAKSEKTPGVSGVFRIDADSKDIVGSKYVFNNSKEFLKRVVKAEQFPVFAQNFIDYKALLSIETKKALVDGIYWLPEKVTEEFLVSMAGVKISARREIEYTSFFVNIDPSKIPVEFNLNIPAKDDVVFQRDSKLEKTIFPSMPDSTLISKVEENNIIAAVRSKYSTIDGTQHLFESSLSAENEQMNSFEQKSKKFFRLAKGASDELFLYNRVEGLRPYYTLGLSNLILRNSALSLGAGYGINDKKWKSEASYLKFIDQNNHIFFESNFFDTIDFDTYNSKISTIRNSYSSLFIKRDYRDYFYVTGGKLSLGFKSGSTFSIKLSAVNQHEESAVVNTEFGLLNYQNFRKNPLIVAGRYKGINASMLFRNNSTEVSLFAEHTDDNLLDSDFSYSRIRTDFQHIIEPDYSNKFILTLSAGKSSGAVPPQKLFKIGGKTLMDYYGDLRGIGFNSISGDQLISGVIDYSFCKGTVWDSVAGRSLRNKIGRLIRLTFWLGAAKSKISNESALLVQNANLHISDINGVYHEFGIGIGDRFNLTRFDFLINSQKVKQIQFSFNFLR